MVARCCATVPRQGVDLNNLVKNLVIWLVIGLVLMTVFNQFNTRSASQTPMPYSQFVEDVKAGKI